MCGICGIIPFDKRPVDEQSLGRMMACMKYRGPDDEGMFTSTSIGLGFVRLSVLDLTLAGHQPMSDKAGRYVIVFNGEIYNYIEIREELKGKGIEFFTNTDTEVLLKSYIYYGEECLNKFNGMFAFVIYDQLNGNVFAARDRFGVKPFYYYLSDSGLIFASEIPPILAVYGQTNQPNEQMIFDYLTFSRTDHTENTFFKNIKKLQHGCCFTIKGNKVEFKKWYDLKSHIKFQESDSDKYRQLLVDAVKLRLRSDVPVGVCLSGGLDSSAITSIVATELNNPQINTFSAVYQKGDTGDESKFIHLYDELLPNMFEVFPTRDNLYHDLLNFVRIHGEPIPTTSPYAQYLVFKLAKERVTVTLDGQGADEQLGGYHYFFGFYFKDLLRHFKLITLIRECFMYFKVHRSIYGFKTFLYFLLPKQYRTSLRVSKAGYLTREFISKFSGKNKKSVVNDLYASDSMKDALINHFEFKLEHLLKWDDRNSMAHSVESRTPFLDYRLVEYTLSIKSDSIIKNGFTKSILRESLKNILPEKIRLRRDKIGFATPEDEWFRSDLFKSFIFELLDSASFKSRNIVSTRQALSLYNKHLNREIDISRDIWKWINLELWFRQFIDV